MGKIKDESNSFLNSSVQILNNLSDSNEFQQENTNEVEQKKDKEIKPIVLEKVKKEKKFSKSFYLSEKYIKLIEVTAKANKLSENRALELMLDKLLSIDTDEHVK